MLTRQVPAQLVASRETDVLIHREDDESVKKKVQNDLIDASSGTGVVQGLYLGH